MRQHYSKHVWNSKTQHILSGFLNGPELTIDLRWRWVHVKCWLLYHFCVLRGRRCHSGAGPVKLVMEKQISTAEFDSVQSKVIVKKKAKETFEDLRTDQNVIILLFLWLRCFLNSCTFGVQSLLVNQVPLLCIILGCNFYRKAEPASQPPGTLNAY